VCTLLKKKGFPIFDFPSIDQKPKITRTFNAIVREVGIGPKGVFIATNLRVRLIAAEFSIGNGNIFKSS
jgi:hypothetical protein